MDGDGVRAGFKQIVSERRQADLGTLGRGRMVITAPTATSVQVAEEAPPTVFGFKLASISSALSNATVDRPGRRAAGDVGRFHRRCPMPARPSSSASTFPMGSSEVIKLTATTSATPGPNEFTIGVDASRHRRPICRRR